jgi:hypothetical protein
MGNKRNKYVPRAKKVKIDQEHKVQRKEALTKGQVNAQNLAREKLFTLLVCII